MHAADLMRFFHPVLPSTALRREPVLVQLAGRKIALFRDGEGRAAALQDACPHRFAPLSRGRVRSDGRLACPYHGWHFDRDGRGKSPSQPELARCDTVAFQAIERCGYIWVASAGVPLSSFPVTEWTDEGFELVGAFGARFDAPLHVAFDNFSEDEHTPWVHTFLGWREEALERLEYSAKNYDDRTEVQYKAPQRRSPWTPLLLIRDGDSFHNRWETRFDPVRTVYTLHWSDPVTGAPRPVISRFAIYFVPETDKTTWLHTFAYGRVADPRFRLLWPVIRRVIVHLGKNEVEDDRRFIPAVADTPFELEGMRLGKYDKPIIRNHKLLSKLYYGEAPRLRVVEDAGDAPEQPEAGAARESGS